MQLQKILESHPDFNSFLLDSRNIIFERDKLGKKKLLGKGDSGKVYKAIWNNFPVAIKELVFEETSEEGRQAFLEKCKGFDQMFLGNISPNFLKLHGYFCDPTFSLVYEYMENGDLNSFLHVNDTLNWNLKLR